MKIKLNEKIAYSLGDFCNNGAYMYVGTFLISFLTICLGLSGTMAGAIIMVVTFFDAANDLIIGSMVDKAHGRGKKYTSIMRMSVLPIGVLTVLLFFSPNFSMAAKVVYILLVYGAYTVAQTSYQVPYGSLSGAMTSDTNDRIALGAFRDWGANLGSFIVNTFASLLILYFGGGKMNARGFLFGAVIVAILVMAGGMVPATFCKERVPVVEAQEAPFKEGIRAFFKNRNMVIATIVICMVDTTLLVRASFTAYYAQYYLKNAELISPILSVMSLVPLVAIFFVPLMTRKLGRKVMFGMAGVCMILSGLIQLLGGTLAASIVASLFCGFSLCCSVTVTWGAIPDFADYGEYITGVFCPGICYSTLTFIMKVAEALGSMALGVILDRYGFSASNVTEQAVNGISLWYGLIPIILGAVALVTSFTFTLTQEKLDEVHRELAVRHQASASGGEN